MTADPMSRVMCKKGDSRWLPRPIARRTHLPNSSSCPRSGRKPALAESRSRRRRCTWHARVMQVACNKTATIMQRCHASLMPSSCKIPSKYHAKIHLSIMPSSCKIPTLGTVSRSPQVRAVAAHAAVQVLVAAARGDAAQARTGRAPARSRNRASVAVRHGLNAARMRPSQGCYVWLKAAKMRQSQRCCSW